MSKQLLIFVAGPYSHETAVGREKHVKEIYEAVKQIMKRGHLVLEGHSLLHAFHESPDISFEEIMNQTLSWLEFCDAIYYIDLLVTPGVQKELDKAKQLGLEIFNKLDDIPDLKGSR